MEISGLTWGLTIALVLALLAVDLVLAAMRPHKVGFKEAVAWSVFYVGVAVVFGIWFAGGDAGTQYFAGWIVEKSLSADNLFVFVTIMTTFAVPERHQHKVLTFASSSPSSCGRSSSRSAPRCCRCSRSCFCCSGCS